MRHILFGLFALALSGCAVGPLVSHETARTVGSSNHELIGGYGTASYVFKWNYGVTRNLDLGLHWEALSIGLRAKYNLFGVERGWALAVAGGIGSSVGGSHYYGDLMTSYFGGGGWEPYGTARVVHVKTDPVELRDKDTGHVDFTVPSAQYDYGQVILGTRYWFTPHWLFSGEVSSLIAFTSGLKFSDGVLVGASFGYRF